MVFELLVLSKGRRQKLLKLSTTCQTCNQHIVFFVAYLWSASDTYSRCSRLKNWAKCTYMIIYSRFNPRRGVGPDQRRKIKTIFLTLHLTKTKIISRLKLWSQPYSWHKPCSCPIPRKFYRFSTKNFQFPGNVRGFL